MSRQGLVNGNLGNSNSAGRGHALVIGGSLAGLLAARVLSEHFERVTVVERDRFPSAPAPRKGVPQAKHVHALLGRGRMIIEGLFPGISDELVAAGAHPLDIAGDFAWLTPAGWGPRFASGLKMLAFARPLLDWHVSRRVRALGRVTILEDTELVRLLPRGRGRGVAGAVVRPRGTRAGESPSEVNVNADLVVDAGGRGSRAPQWLEALGYEPPRETVVKAFIGYASRLYRLPEGARSGWECAYVQAAPPEQRRSGILFPVEGGLHLLTLAGGGRDYPPTDEEGYLQFAHSLPDPIIYDAVKDAEPVSPVCTHHATENRVRHFERLSQMPENFVVLGDAACAFNPVYGQGMTTAALGAEALAQTLREQSRRRPDGRLEGLSGRFQKRLARVNAGPWMLATGEDYRYREVEGGRPTLATRLTHRYMDGVVRLSTTDRGVRRLLLEVFNMLAPPSALFRPSVAARVAGSALRFRARGARAMSSPEPAVGGATVS